MLTYTFCGMGGLGIDAEKMLWKKGFLCWNDYQRINKPIFSAEKHLQILADLDMAQSQLKKGIAGLRWFLKKLPAACHCRLFPHLCGRGLYLDIETTGLARDDVITTISLGDGHSCKTFVRGNNLNEAVAIIRPDSVFITFNGRLFDIPFMRREFSLSFRQMNIDLRWGLKGWGITGGLKHAEKILGIRRMMEPNVSSGRDAVELWFRSQRGDFQALETLCRYNQDDVYSLVKIYHLLYNMSMKEHPFHSDIRIV
ncbi:MAG: ribonuclease H-like domain-containing protein [Thermoguttaceae bacterium]|nr:ribonuclease H-like domain-containing protein [Thermoguttaceae bacterium]